MSDPIPESGAPTNHPDPDSHAPWDRISFGPIGRWAEVEAYDKSVAAKEGNHVTALLLTRQIDAEAGETFFHHAHRLETSLAVQNESQWKLELHPRSQQVKLHWLRVVRGEAVTDQLQRERMRLIQRETQLEHLVINGSWTLLVVLDDVRPGDVIESAYSVVNRHPINAGGCEAFFAVPARAVVGRYRLRLLAEAGRPNLRFRTSAAFPAVAERTLADGRQEWSWQGEQRHFLDPEPNVPSTAMAFLWVQISDVRDWAQLSRRVAEAWEESAPDTDSALMPELARPPQMDAAAVARLIRHIQDNFRYLSVDLETGSWIPASPAAVALQRRGDCKDLAWLATAILRRWGVFARPVLVATAIREAVASFLPASSLFNHALLEVECEGTRRWFDLTLKFQGGSFLTQAVGIYGYGLPVDRPGAELSGQPGNATPAFFAVREIIDIDTRTDMPSAIELRVRLEGAQADTIRQSRAAQGAEAFAKDRLVHVQRRFPNAKRVGELQWQDDREQNVCAMVEAFETVLSITPGDRGGRSAYELPANVIVRSLPVPEDKPRLQPWSMPHPVDFRHLYMVRSKSLGHFQSRRRRWSGTNYAFTLEEIRLPGEWSLVTRLRVHGDLPAAEVADYRTKYRDYLRVAMVRFFLPARVRRPEVPADWGQLPAAARGRAAYVSDDDPQGFPEAQIGEKPLPPTKRSWRDYLHRPSRTNLRLVWYLSVGLLMLVRSCTAHP